MKCSSLIIQATQKAEAILIKKELIINTHLFKCTRMYQFNLQNFLCDQFSVNFSKSLN